jgi:hypothetical protein
MFFERRSFLKVFILGKSSNTFYCFLWRSSLPTANSDWRDGMELGTEAFWETNSRSTSQDFYGTRRCITFFGRARQWSLSEPRESSPYLLIHWNINLSSISMSSQWSRPFWLFDQNVVWTCHISHVCYMPCTQSPWFDHPNNTSWSTQTMKPLIIHNFLELPLLKVKVKVKLSLCFQLSTTPWWRFTPRERALGTHWIRGWVCPRACLDAVVQRKIHSPCWD